MTELRVDLAGVHRLHRPPPSGRAHTAPPRRSGPDGALAAVRIRPPRGCHRRAVRSDRGTGPLGPVRPRRRVGVEGRGREVQARPAAGAGDGGRAVEPRGRGRPPAARLGRVGPVCTRGSGLAAVTFATIYRVAELLGAPGLAGAGRRPVSTPVIAAALRAALAEDPGLFAPVAAHPATEAALVATYRELREVSPAGLDALAEARTAGRRRRAGPPGRPCAAWRRRGTTRRTSWRPRPWRCAKGPGDHGLGPVVVYLPQRLSRHGAELLGAVAGVTDTDGAGRHHRRGVGRRRAGARPRPPGTPTAPAAPRFDPPPVDRRRRLHPDRAGLRRRRRGALRRPGRGRRGAGAAPPSTASPSSTPAPSPTPASSTSTSPPPGSRPTAPAVVPLAGRVAGRLLLDLLALPERGFRRRTCSPGSGPLRSATTGAGRRRRRGSACPRGRGGRRAVRVGRPPARTLADANERPGRGDRGRSRRSPPGGRSASAPTPSRPGGCGPSSSG